MLVAADVYRPAAIDQLQTIGKQIDVPVHALGTNEEPADGYRDQSRVSNASAGKSG